MTEQPGAQEARCLDLALDRPAAVPADCWLAAWQDACTHRQLPSLRTFTLGPDACRLSIARNDGLTPSLIAVARLLEGCGRRCPAPAPAPADGRHRC